MFLRFIGLLLDIYIWTNGYKNCRLVSSLEFYTGFYKKIWSVPTFFFIIVYALQGLKELKERTYWTRYILLSTGYILIIFSIYLMKLKYCDGKIGRKSFKFTCFVRRDDSLLHVRQDKELVKKMLYGGQFEKQVLEIPRCNDIICYFL